MVRLRPASHCIFKFLSKFHTKTQFLPHRKLCVCIIVINWLSLHTWVIAVYCENHMKPLKYTLWAKCIASWCCNQWYTYSWTQLECHEREWIFCVIIYECCYNWGVHVILTVYVMVNSDELIGTTEYLMLYTRCHINQCHHNRLWLYFTSYAVNGYCVLQFIIASPTLNSSHQMVHPHLIRYDCPSVICPAPWQPTVVLDTLTTCTTMREVRAYNWTHRHT
jgi:hypothetical protein